MSFRKIEIIVFSKGEKIKLNLSFMFGNEPLNVVKKYTYLGIPFVSSGLFEIATKELVTKANIAVNSTLRLISSTKLNSWKKINKLFDTLVTSVVLYSSPVWSIRYINLLEKVQCQFYKRLLNLPMCTAKDPAQNHRILNLGEIFSYSEKLIVFDTLIKSVHGHKVKKWKDFSLWPEIYQRCTSA